MHNRFITLDRYKILRSNLFRFRIGSFGRNVLYTRHPDGGFNFLVTDRTCCRKFELVRTVVNGKYKYTIKGGVK